MYGKSTLGLGSYIPWGLWVALYTFFLGLTAGAFLITILTYVFRFKIFYGIGPLSAFAVVVTIVAEMIIITLDVGHSFRMYGLLFRPNFKSMITWMVIFTLAMLVIYILETYYLLREEIIRWSQDPGVARRKIYQLLALGRTCYGEKDRQQDSRRVDWLSLLSIPVGLFFYGSNGAVFAVLLNRPIWNSTLTPLLFIVSALVSGGALIMLLTFMFKRDDEVIQLLGRTVRFLLVVMLILEFLHFFISYQWDVTYIVNALDLVLYGPYWWNFWVIHLALGSLLPLYFMIRYHENAQMLAWASFLIVITFVSFRLNFIIPSASARAARLFRTDHQPGLRELPLDAALPGQFSVCPDSLAHRPRLHQRGCAGVVHQRAGLRACTVSGQHEAARTGAGRGDDQATAPAAPRSATPRSTRPGSPGRVRSWGTPYPEAPWSRSGRATAPGTTRNRAAASGGRARSARVRRDV